MSSILSAAPESKTKDVAGKSGRFGGGGRLEGRGSSGALSVPRTKTWCGPLDEAMLILVGEKYRRPCDALN